MIAAAFGRDGIGVRTRGRVDYVSAGGGQIRHKLAHASVVSAEHLLVAAGGTRSPTGLDPMSA